MGVSGQRHAPPSLYTGERTPGTHSTGGWVGPRADVDTELKGKIILPLPGMEPRSPGPSSDAVLSYPGSHDTLMHVVISVVRIDSSKEMHFV
jgi:hypothetical protein